MQRCRRPKNQASGHYSVMHHYPMYIDDSINSYVLRSLGTTTKTTVICQFPLAMHDLSDSLSTTITILH